MLQAPSLPTTDVFGECSNLFLRKNSLQCLCCCLARAGPALREQNSVKVLAYRWCHCSYQYVFGRSQRQEGRFTMCKGGSGHKEQKPPFPLPQFHSDTISVLLCSFTICLTDDVSFHGNMVRLQSGIQHTPPRVSLLPLSLLSFLTPALIKGDRTGDGRPSEGWGRLAWAHPSTQSVRLKESQGASSDKMETTPFGCVDSQGYSGRTTRKKGFKDSQDRARTNPKLQVSWMFKKERRNVGENWRAGNGPVDKELGMKEKGSIWIHCTPPHPTPHPQMVCL